MRPTFLPNLPRFASLISLAKPLIVGLSLGLLLGLALAPAALAQDLAPGALEQIEALRAEKLSRSPALQKVDSRLAIEHRRLVDPSFAAALPQLRRGFERRDDGRILVDLRAEVTEETALGLEDILRDLGAEVVSSHPRWNRLRAWMDLATLETLAGHSDVRWIRPAGAWIAQGLPSHQPSDPRVPIKDAAITKGANVTEGDVAHGANLARANLNIDGCGVTACAMSDSVEALADLQTSGDLPAGVTVLAGQSGTGTSEGTALLEIIHDMAPGSDLGFATGLGGEAQMAQNILDLRDVVGCDVIVDDILYLTEPVFQDGIVAQAVNDVVQSGVFYFTSAGNSGNLNDGESGVFEGDYTAGALPAVLTGAGASAHDYGGGDVANEVTTDSPFFFTLQWSDPFDASANDYDLYLLDAALANVLDASTATQNGTQPPLEAIDTTADDDTGNHLVVVQFAGTARHLHLNTHRGRLEHGSDGQIFGHPGAAQAITIAAVDVATAGGGLFTGGAANPVEFFSSDGPRRIFFNADGSPVSALGDGGLAKGGQTSIERQKPDFAAADGVSTNTPGFNPFFGTSASAPHSAAIAALFKDLFPEAGVQEFYNIFRSSALDIEDLGFDRDSGFGIQTMQPDPASVNPIFSDGFESGDTSSWTVSTP